MRRVYLDHNATTPVHPEVLAAMMPFFQEHFGNASSIHWAGREVKKYLDEAREKVAALMNANPEEIVFTGCGTESDNMAIKGVALALQEKGRHIITTQVEHHAVLHTCQFLEKMGYEITYLPVDSTGMIDLEELRRSIKPQTVLISIMFANNETGTIFPVQEIGEIAREKGILFHTDAVQAMGKIPVDLKKLPVDILSLSGTQVKYPQGNRGPVHPPRNKDVFPHPWRRPGAEPARRYREHPLHHRAGESLRGRATGFRKRGTLISLK